MNRILAVMLVMAAAACAGRDRMGKPARPWTREGMNMPESAYVDPASGTLFVSQIVGNPGEKDGKGWISKLDLDGNVGVERWVSGLNAPKGLRSFGGTLWVSDLDTLVSIEIATGKVLKRVKIEGAKFLNDVTCGPDGSVYVSDTMGGAIYRYKNGKVTTFAKGEQLENPNGLLIEGNSLVVAGWGSPIAEDFTTKTPGRLYRLDLATGKKKTLITPEPTANMDGLESDGRGGYIVSDWVAGKVYRIGADGRTTVLLTRGQGTADLSYLPSRRLLILPEMLKGRVSAIPLK